MEDDESYDFSQILVENRGVAISESNSKKKKEREKLKKKSEKVKLEKKSKKSKKDQDQKDEETNDQNVSKAESEKVPESEKVSESVEEKVDKKKEKKEKKKEKVDKKQLKKGENGIWIGNLNFSTTRNQIFQFFKDCGFVARIKFPFDPQTKKNRGFAYVDFGSQEAQDKAVQLSENELDGRKVLIKRADDFKVTGRPPRKDDPDQDDSKSSAPKKEPRKDFNSNNNSINIVKPQQQHQEKENEKGVKEKNETNYDPSKKSRKIFVGNLSFETTKEELEKFFSKFGQVEAVRMPVFEDSQRCKGFAHIIFQQQLGADKVVDRAKVRMGTRVLRVEYGAKEEYAFGGDGGDGLGSAGNNNKRKLKGNVQLGLPSEKRTKITFDNNE